MKHWALLVVVGVVVAGCGGNDNPPGPRDAAMESRPDQVVMDLRPPETASSVDLGTDTTPPPPVDMGTDTTTPPPVDMGTDTTPPAVDMGTDTTTPPPVDMGPDVPAPVDLAPEVPPVDTAPDTAPPNTGTPAGPNCGCVAGEKLCTAGCVKLDDPRYGCAATTCSRCQRAHATATCAAGACQFQCEPNWADCNGDPADGCEAFLGNKTTCGSCNTACTGTDVCGPSGCVATCPVPLTNCSGTCENLISSKTSCGACGLACAGTCAGGTCPTAASCGDTSKDPQNCGACGTVCPAGGGIAVCENSQCGVRCPAGTSKCGSSCVALTSDNANCGGCGVTCATNCINGQCEAAGADTLVTGLTGQLTLAADASFLYLADATGGTISRVAKAGGARTTLAMAQARPSAIAADACHVYWPNTLGAAVMRTRKDGNGSAAAQLVSQFDSPTEIAVDGTHAYWLKAGDAVYRAPKAGGTAVVAAQGALGSKEVYAFALDADRIYYTYRQNLSRNVAFTSKVGGAETVILGAGEMTAAPLLYADATHLAVAKRLSGTLSVYATTGTPALVSSAAAPGNPPAAPAVAMDQTHVYWVDDTSSTWTLKAAAKCGGPVRVLRTYGVSGGGVVPALVVDGQVVYVALGTKVMRAPAVGTPWPSTPAACPP